MSSKWAASPLLDSPFPCLTGWIPLTTWTGRLGEGEECGYCTVIVIQLPMSHSAPVSLTGAYQCTQKLCSSHHFRRPHHPHIVVIVTRESESRGSFSVEVFNSWRVWWHKFNATHGGLASA